MKSRFAHWLCSERVERFNVKYSANKMIPRLWCITNLMKSAHAVLRFTRWPII
ncbi:Uncharacterised protein [Vibrio cholerae]|nr:Uncharacterised protein [Vibrio cholerae]